MPTNMRLPGFDRMIATCQQHSLPMALTPPTASAPRAGELVLGEPLDPQLAAVYQRLSTSTFGPFTLYGLGLGEHDLIPRNQWLREYGAIYFQAPLSFGQDIGFSLYYGTVPRLADSHGLQPVVYIQAHSGEQFAIPIASSVDRFFDLYSRYLERMAVDFEYVHTGLPELVFPWSVPGLVAADAPLIAQVRSGRFDFLANDEEGARMWVAELLSSPPAPA
jgi:hypothetical protein